LLYLKGTIRTVCLPTDGFQNNCFPPPEFWLFAGTSKIKAIKDGKQVEFAKRVNIQIDKNHINGVTTRGKIVMTPHGFILDNDKSLKAYKEEQSAAWKAILGGGDFVIAEEDQAYEDITAHTQEPS
jgi:hypothetical protein